MSDIVELLTERRKLRYAGDCKCGKCCLVPHEMLCSAIDEIKRLRASPTPPTTEGRDERDAFEVWAHADHRRIEPEEYEERTPDNTLYYADDSTNQAYVGWCAALLSSPRVEDVRRMREALEAIDELEVMEINPSNYDHDIVCELSSNAAQAASIARAALSPPDGDGKQEQATRASGPTAPTDR